MLILLNDKQYNKDNIILLDRNTNAIMNNGYFPNDLIINKAKDFFDFESHSLIQFYHRNIAYFIFIECITPINILQ